MYVTDTFWSSLCALFGQSHYSNSVIMLRKWQSFEGGNAEWNPLNTTENWPGAWLYNSSGVKNYRTQEDGINATAATLRNGHYPSIVWALENNVPVDSWSKAPIPAEVDTWGTHGFAAYLRTMPPTPIPIPPFIEEVDMFMVHVPNGSIYLLTGSDLLSVVDGADATAIAARVGEPVDVDEGFYTELMAKYPQTAAAPAPAPPVAIPPTM